mgnify:FL=1
MRSLTEHLGRRELIHTQLAVGKIHILAVLRNPDPAVATVPIGDVLCWCQGLDEATVARILQNVEVNWGRRVDLVSGRDQQRILWQIKHHRPLVWDGWRETLKAA